MAEGQMLLRYRSSSDGDENGVGVRLSDQRRRETSTSLFPLMTPIDWRSFRMRNGEHLDVRTDFDEDDAIWKARNFRGPNT